MKIIFLDIDGVLVTRRLGVFEEPLLQNLKRVVTETGSVIVLSSDWRRHPQARMEAKRVLATVGLTFIACTPALSAYIAQRPTEIMQWKRDYCKRSDNERVTNWVAIDDRPLLEERHGTHLRGHFVQTQPMRGLTEMVADECIEILNRDPPPSRPQGGAAAAEVLSPDGLVALGASMRANNATASGGNAGIRGGAQTGPPLGGSPGSKRAGLAALGGPSLHSLSLGESPTPENSSLSPALPSVGRQRGRSTGAPPMVGGRR